MNRIEKELLEVLKTIEGNGSFAVSGVNELVVPGLQIKGLGEVGLPLNPKQIKDIIKVAHKAPFGKGSKTITDTKVRSAWEIDADKLTFKNKSWKEFIQNITEDVKAGLGVENKSVDLSLYKLLIYEEGDFFLPHKDSEKEKGMFATLVVALPSEHTGGELLVRFDGREHSIDFSEAASSYQMPFVAFYADCEHEIKPVTSGYRVCLVYNLLQSSKGTPISSPEFSEQVGEMSILLKSWIGSADIPKAILLGHEYTPANYALADLKGHDRPRAEALIAAAESAGFFARLGLVTEYQMGQLENYDDYGDYYSRRRRRYDDDYDTGDPTTGTMGELYEHERKIEHWAEDDNPGLGEVSIDEDDVLTDIEMGTGEPSEKEAEGYTGNAGMTMEYWYHYGAVVVWRKDKHFEMLQQRPMSIQLDWLKFYAENWNDASLNAEAYTKQLLAGMNLTPDQYGSKSYLRNDFTGFAAAFVKINDKKLLQKELTILEEVFDKITVETWRDLIGTYKGDTFKKVFLNIGNSNNINALHHLLHILQALNASASKPSRFVLNQIQELPNYLTKSELHTLSDSSYRFYNSDEPTRTDKTREIITMTLALSEHKAKDLEWIKNTAEGITKSMPRDYVNEVLFPILSQQKNKGQLFHTLYESGKQDFQKRTAKKPTPPKDWKRAVPKSDKYDAEVWKMLTPFLQSPTQQVFDYVKNESYRKNVEYAISGTTVDLKTETIRRGRPYTLRLTKTQTAYELKLKHWKEDVKLLDKLEKVKMK